MYHQSRIDEHTTLITLAFGGNLEDPRRRFCKDTHKFEISIGDHYSVSHQQREKALAYMWGV